MIGSHENYYRDLKSYLKSVRAMQTLLNMINKQGE